MTALMSAALEASDRALSEGRESYVISGERNLLDSADLAGHGAPARAVRAVRAQDAAHADPRPEPRARRACRSSSAASPASRRSTSAASSTAPYEVDGEVVGTVGVIGPTRMAYERVIPIVDVTAKLLSSALSQH